ncbi:MAG: hypothetical protein LUC45_07675, partial [Paraprevotella sp.]|nr:hypothetical protein [Paraprevotella sp.]
IKDKTLSVEKKIFLRRLRKKSPQIEKSFGAEKISLRNDCFCVIVAAGRKNCFRIVHNGVK